MVWTLMTDGYSFTGPAGRLNLSERGSRKAASCLTGLTYSRKEYR